MTALDIFKNANDGLDRIIAERDALRAEVGELKTQTKALQLSAAPEFSPEANALIILLARQEMHAEAIRAIAQTALDRGGDKELVYAPLYQQALEDIASEPQDE